jgi:hypothetical protein
MCSDPAPLKGDSSSPPEASESSEVQEKLPNGHVDEESARGVSSAPSRADGDVDKTRTNGHYMIVNSIWQFFSVDYGHKCTLNGFFLLPAFTN